MYMYLVQRGTFKNDKPINEYSSLFGNREARMIDFDYMGSAEFEWGSVPKSIQRIFKAIDENTIEANSYEDMKNYNGFPLVIISPNHETGEQYKEIIKEYLDERAPHSTKKITHHLKEYISLEDHYYGESCLGNGELGRDNFWLDINNDIIFFFGNKDFMLRVMTLLHEDFKSHYIKNPK